MKGSKLLLVVIVLIFSLVLSACEDADTALGPEGRRARGVEETIPANDNNVEGEEGVIPVTGEDSTNENLTATENVNENADNNLNANDNVNDNANANLNANVNDNGNANDNLNDNEGVGDSRVDDADGRDLYRLSQLRDYTVKNRSGETIGNVEALLVQRTSWQIAYVVLDLDDGIDGEDDYVLVPWSAFDRVGTGSNRSDNVNDNDNGNENDNPGRGNSGNNPGRGNSGNNPGKGNKNRNDNANDNSNVNDNNNANDNTNVGSGTPSLGRVRSWENLGDQALVYQHDRNSLANAPGFSDDDLVNLHQAGWEGSVERYWRDRGANLSNTGQAGSLGLVWLDDDQRLLAANGEEIGEIEDALVHFPSGKVTHLVVDARDWDDIDENYVLVPTSQLDWDGEGRRIQAKFEGNRFGEFQRANNLDDVRDLED